MKFIIKRRIKGSDGKDGWVDLCPEGSSEPYIFKTQEEAFRMVKMHYPDAEYGQEIKVTFEF